MSRSVWPVLGMTAAISLVAAVAISSTSIEGATKARPVAAAKAPEPTPEPKPTFRVPRGATEQDLNLMLAWLERNDGCRGSHDSATIDRECPKRDAAGKQLAARGWCWDYPDRPASEADWHRCAEDAVHHGPALVSRVDTIKAELEPYYAAAVGGQVLAICGIRSGDWAGRIVRNVNILNDRLAQRLSEAERAQVGDWERGLENRIKAHMIPGGNYAAIKCRELAASNLPEQLDAIDWKLTGGYH